MTKDILKLFDNCELCPRECKVNRSIGQLGFCGASNAVEVNRIDLHFMEEPIISGKNGSGTVFFTHCTLGCIYCQNFKISRKNSVGKILTEDELAKEFLRLEKLGANNINLVSPTHYMPIIYKACLSAREQGLAIPFVYNTSGFEKAENIELLKDVIDIFLTDLKYSSPYLSKRYSQSEDYSDYALEAIEKMVEITGEPKFSKNGMLKSGVVIRHLMLPEQISDTVSVLKKIANNFGDKVLVSLMRQYTPINSTLPDALSKTITDDEYLTAKTAFEEFGLNGFIQDDSSIGKDKIPEWDL